MEVSKTQASGIEKFTPPENVTVNHVQTKRFPKQTSETQCRNCGFTWPHKDGPCPAKGKMCNTCGKSNHFSRVCRTKQDKPQNHGKPGNGKPAQRKFTPKPKSHIRQVASQQCPESSDSSEDEYLYTLGQQTPAKTPTVSVLVNNVPVRMMIDTGASTDIMDESSFDELNKKSVTQMQAPTKRIFAYGADAQLTVLGHFPAHLCVGEKSVQSAIHVLKGNHGSLLSYKTACNLGLIDIKINHVQDHSHVGDELVRQYPKLFQGIGKLKDAALKLHIDEAVTPVAQAARRIPFHVRQKVSDELDNLERQGIIEKVEGATPWVSPLVIIPKKNGDVRLCVDMRMANKAIRRERHPTPTVDDLIHILNGATVFSKLDLRAGYHQIPLAVESRYITTFVTHKGLRRYARLNFGTNSASEIFQNISSEQIRDIQGSLNISDDVIVFGKSQADHDKALKAVFQKFAEVDLTLNKSKCAFNKFSLSFFGFVFSKDGISPDPRKVEAIHSMDCPLSVHEVRSFLGMATYCAKFIPSFSDISHPLRELTKKDVTFEWTPLHQSSFEEIKRMLTSDAIMSYFDPQKETDLTTDASPVGLSAILSQRTPGRNDRKVVVYASRSLSDVERRYSQTEKEALAIVWAIERLHLYLYGKRFTLFTDCKPVQLIFSNPKSKPPARIERWNLRL